MTFAPMDPDTDPEMLEDIMELTITAVDSGGEETVPSTPTSITSSASAPEATVSVPSAESIAHARSQSLATLQGDHLEEKPRRKRSPSADKLDKGEKPLFFLGQYIP
jgi:hypothetical protein